MLSTITPSDRIKKMGKSNRPFYQQIPRVEWKHNHPCNATWKKQKRFRVIRNPWRAGRGEWVTSIFYYILQKWKKLHTSKEVSSARCIMRLSNGLDSAAQHRCGGLLQRICRLSWGTGKLPSPYLTSCEVGATRLPLPLTSISLYSHSFLTHHLSHHHLLFHLFLILP